MKKASLIIIAGVSALMMQACNHRPKVPDSVKEADSTNAANDTPRADTDKRTQAEVNDNDDAKFAVKAASGGLSEVELGKLAIKKAHNASVRAFGAMMVADHSKANKVLTALADSDHLSLPQYPGNKEEKLSD
ncbi:MAG: DUF4142 domain-containing protein, partial [Mucilaginibacter sp.]